MAEMKDLKKEVDELVGSVKSLFDAQSKKDTPPPEQPTVDDLITHVHEARVAVEAVIANEAARVAEIQNLGGVGQDVNPSGPTGVTEGHVGPTGTYTEDHVRAGAVTMPEDQG